jgi:hypothetical protein
LLAGRTQDRLVRDRKPISSNLRQGANR